jgi:CRP/FNR family cyclic AMP-dependent transcriptional regulator
MSHLLTRNIRVEADLVDQLFNSSEKRLARMLLLLANFAKERKPEPVIAKISQETLAQMIGTTQPRGSFFMNKFRKLGFIDYNGHLEVHSSLLNVILHDDPAHRQVSHFEPIFSFFLLVQSGLFGLTLVPLGMLAKSRGTLVIRRSR